MKTTQFVPVSILFASTVLLLGACGGDKSLVDSCNASYDCDGTPSRTSLQGDRCMLGQIWLSSDGRAVHSELPNDSTWNETETGLVVCMGGDCFACTQLGSPEPAPSTGGSGGGGKCVGSAGSCSSFSGAGSGCSGQEGCESHAVWGFYNGNYQLQDYECDGSPKRCSSFEYESSCKRQSGCSWK